MRKVELSIKGHVVGEYPWTAIPTLADKLVRTIHLRKLNGTEKIFVACANKQAIAIFSNDKSRFKVNLEVALKELQGILNDNNIPVFELMDIAS